MANQKISQLSGASTPLAGTEVVPLVQSGATVKVAVSNLTAGRAVQMSSLDANGGSSTGGAIVSGSISGVRASSTVVDVGDGHRYLALGANASTPGVIKLISASSDASIYQYLLTSDTSYNLTFNVGNLIQGTAAKGVNFTANTPAAGMTSQLLNWYEEGTWTPGLTTAGGNFTALTFADSQGTYARVGRQVTVRGYFYTTGTVSGGSGQVYITGMPFSAASLAVGNVWVNPDTANYSSPSALPTGVYTSGTQLRLFKNGTTNNSTFNSTELATSGNANYFVFTATYFV